MHPDEYVVQVKSSKTWRALSEYATKELSTEDIIELRHVVICKNSSNTTSNNIRAVPCDPLEAPCSSSLKTPV